MTIDVRVGQRVVNPTPIAFGIISLAASVMIDTERNGPVDEKLKQLVGMVPGQTVEFDSEEAGHLVVDASDAVRQLGIRMALAGSRVVQGYPESFNISTEMMTLVSLTAVLKCVQVAVAERFGLTFES